MTRHELKVWPDPWAAIRSGMKRFEIRREDQPGDPRRFETDDELWLREFVPCVECNGSGEVESGATFDYGDSPTIQPCEECRGARGKYTGDDAEGKIRYVSRGRWGLPPGVVVFDFILTRVPPFRPGEVREWRDPKKVEGIEGFGEPPTINPSEYPEGDDDGRG